MFCVVILGFVFVFTVYVCLNLVSSLCCRFFFFFFFPPPVLTPQLLCEDDFDSCVFVLVCVWGGGGIPIQRQGTMNAEINVPAENAEPLISGSPFPSFYMWGKSEQL